MRTAPTSPVARLLAILLTLAGLGLPAAVYAAAESGSALGQRTVPTARSRSSAAQTRTRRSRAAQARAASAARQRAALEAATPRFKLDENGAVVPDIRAEAAIVYNPVTGAIIWAQNAESQRSIASITKLMTAVIFVEAGPELTREVVVRAADVHRASVTYLRAGERVSIDTLLHLLLIASDNAAARVLARISPWGTDGFIERMNEKASELGLEHTAFTDPSGLDAGNVSSAYDLSKLLVYAAKHEQLAPVMRTQEYTVRTNRRRVKIENTNRLLGSEFDVLGGKTGFIRKAGYCLATLLQLPQGPQVAVVVLGAQSNVSRFMETRHIVNWLLTTAKDLFLTESAAQQEE